MQIAVVGLGTSGTQTLIYGFVANYYRTNVRGAGVAWCAGFGRLGGVGGPLLGGFLISGGFALNAIFYILAGLAILGVLSACVLAGVLIGIVTTIFCAVTVCKLAFDAYVSAKQGNPDHLSI